MLTVLAFPGGGVLAQDTVVYGFDKNFPPYSFVRARESVGFEVELLRAVFDDSGMKLEMRPMDEWERVQAELSSNTVHVSSGMTRTELREKLFIFPDRSNLVLRGRFFTRLEDRVPRAGDLRGRAVSVKKASIYHTRVQNFGGFKVYAYETDEEALNAMWMGETVAYFGPDKTAYWHIEQNDLEDVAAVGRPVDETRIYYAFYKGRTELRDFVFTRLGELRRSGEYDRIYRKWFVPELLPEERDALIEAARNEARKSFVPYGGGEAGAALLSRTGKTYAGAGVESARPESGVSALESAVAAAVAAGDVEFRAAVLVDAQGRVVPPDPAERTLLLEFGRGVLVLVELEKGEYDAIMISRLLPFAAQASP
jgi:cytidine deaminase